MLHIPAGRSNTYTYQIPKSMPQGAYWYHSHLHMLTTSHVYYGLAGLLAIGRTDGNIPLVTEKQIPVRNMLLQYNFVFDRAGGLAQLNNPNWAQYVSTLKHPQGDELAKGTYRPQAHAGELRSGEEGRRSSSPSGIRELPTGMSGPGRSPTSADSSTSFQATCSALPPKPVAGGDVPADPSLPDYKRDVQFTINGQFQPVIKSKAGQTEIWVLSNISDMVYINAQLTETATGKHPKIAIVGQDGIPYRRGSAIRSGMTEAASSFRRRPATPSPSPCLKAAT